jgi:alpha-tubulin suppressor-like RCC1 family protein
MNVRRIGSGILLVLVGHCGSATRTAPVESPNAVGSVVESALVPDVPPAPGVPREIVDVVAGWGWTCIANADGTVDCWGAQVGGLGYGSGSTAAILECARLRRIAGIDDARDLVAGQMNACAITAARRVRCWGGNESGQLGRGTMSPGEGIPAPPIGLPEDIVELAAGSQHTCARTSGGALFCWGDSSGGELACRGANGSGQLGLVGYHDGTRPVEAVGIDDATRVVVGEGFSAALRADGRVARWGRFATGEGGEWISLVPADVAGIGDGIAISGGRWHVSVLRRSGAVACWGANFRGALGDGKQGGIPPSVVRDFTVVPGL